MRNESGRHDSVLQGWGNLNQFQKSILQETKAKDVQWCSSLSNHTAVQIAANSSKNLGHRVLLGPHRLLFAHTGAQTGCWIAWAPTRSRGQNQWSPACPFLLYCHVHVCVCACELECVSECEYTCVWVCVCTHVSITITFAVLNPSQEAVRRMESLCPWTLLESFLWRAKKWCWRQYVDDRASWLNTTPFHQNPGGAKQRKSNFSKKRNAMFN